MRGGGDCLQVVRARRAARDPDPDRRLGGGPAGWAPEPAVAGGANRRRPAGRPAGRVHGLLHPRPPRHAADRALEGRLLAPRLPAAAAPDADEAVRADGVPALRVPAVVMAADPPAGRLLLPGDADRRLPRGAGDGQPTRLVGLDPRRRLRGVGLGAPARSMVGRGGDRDRDRLPVPALVHRRHQPRAALPLLHAADRAVHVPGARAGRRPAVEPDGRTGRGGGVLLRRAGAVRRLLPAAFGPADLARAVARTPHLQGRLQEQAAGALHLRAPTPRLLLDLDDRDIYPVTWDTSTGRGVSLAYIIPFISYSSKVRISELPYDNISRAVEHYSL